MYFQLDVPLIELQRPWPGLEDDAQLWPLEAALAKRLPAWRWFAGKARTIQQVELADWLTLPGDSGVVLAIVRVEYESGEPETYALPLALATGVRARDIILAKRDEIVAVTNLPRDTWPDVIYDAVAEPAFGTWMLDQLTPGRASPTVQGGMLACTQTSRFAELRGDVTEPLAVRALAVDQSNTALVLGERLFVKLFRRFEGGMQPEAEIGRFLTDVSPFAQTPALAGTLEYQTADGTATLAVVQQFVPCRGSAWQHMLAAASAFYDAQARNDATTATTTLTSAQQAARRLAQRTAELHRALAAGTSPAFAPTTLKPTDWQAWHAQLRSQAAATLELLAKQQPALPPESRTVAQHVLAARESILRLVDQAAEQPIPAPAMRCHGDYHLGQVLDVETAGGEDFVIIDFEGEPTRSLGQRRAKQSPLKDVAGMLRSFHYASLCALDDWQKSATKPPWPAAQATAAAAEWFVALRDAYWASYQATVVAAGLLPSTPGDVERLLAALVLEKALYELGYELNNRPDWARVPLRGIATLLS